MGATVIIGRSNLTMAAYSRSQVEYSRTERLRAWDNRGRAEGHSAGHAAASKPPAPPDGAREAGGSDELPTDAKFTVLIALVEKLTGRKVKVLDAADLRQAPSSCTV